MTRLILASGSAGRKSLLESLGLKFEVIESNVDEEKLQSKDPIEMATLRANAKAESVFNLIVGAGLRPAPWDRSSDLSLRKNDKILILAADTVGFMGDWIFNKPKSREEAEETLARLSGKTHKYVSAHCVIKILKPENPKIQKPDSSIVLPFYSSFTGYDISSVTFRKLTRDDIRVYLDHIDYLKLCGAYKLADSPQNFTVKTEGSISNIIGLSLEKIIPILKDNFLL